MDCWEVKLNIGKKTAVVPTAQQVPRLQNHPNGVFAESIGLDVVVCIRYNVKFSSHAKQHTKFGESCFSGAGKTLTTKSAQGYRPPSPGVAPGTLDQGPYFNVSSDLHQPKTAAPSYE